MREDQKNVEEEISHAVDGMLRWLDVYLSTRNITPSIELQRKVMKAALVQAKEGIEQQLEQYEKEEVARIKRQEELEKSNNPKKGWWLYNAGSRMAVNWHLLERIEQEKFKNKERFFLYRKQRSELMCECADEERASCEKCYGTGFDGGWVFAGSFPAVNVIRNSDGDEFYVTGEGSLNFQVSFFRTIRPDDVVVDEDGKRWRVCNVEGVDRDALMREHYVGWTVSMWSVCPKHLTTPGHEKFPLTHLEKKMEAVANAK